MKRKPAGKKFKQLLFAKLFNFNELSTKFSQSVFGLMVLPWEHRSEHRSEQPGTRMPRIDTPYGNYLRRWIINSGHSAAPKISNHMDWYKRRSKIASKSEEIEWCETTLWISLFAHQTLNALRCSKIKRERERENETGLWVSITELEDSFKLSNWKETTILA